MPDTSSKPSRILRRALGPLTAALGSGQRFAHAMATLRGGITLEEGLALAKAVGAIARGSVVEIGSFRGKSAAALAHGLAGTDRRIYCIDPHEAFVGALGGQFGPEDRAAFFRTMLATGAYENVRLINLPAAQVAASWHEPIGFLFIDGDHRYDAVRQDFELWYPHVVAGGVIAFDDTHVDDLGPSQLLRELLPDRRLRFVEKVGKITFLQKLAHLEPRPREPRRFLVVCHELHVSGGLMRFERVGRELAKRGDRLAFVRTSESRRTDSFPTDLPVLSMAEAAAGRWDATMVPGQGFPETTIQRLDEFRHPRFGQRIQHVLNDRSLREGFLAVNRRFEPHAVVFNNRDWTPGTYTDFRGDRFATLEGAVDAERFASVDGQPREREADTFHVGGLSKAQLRGFWRAFVRRMPAHWTLHLFGTDPELANDDRVRWVGSLADADLPGFYHDLDAVVHAETWAGWANVVAEAMAARVPVVCTTAGTAALGEHTRTARVVARAADDDESRADAILDQLRWVEDHPTEAATMADRAREHVRAFDWQRYADALRELCVDDGRSHYTFAPVLGLRGKWPLAERLEGLDAVLPRVAGKSVLDLGCAEGIVARACFDHGADSVHGFELDASRVATCLDLVPEPRACFVPASLAPWSRFVAAQPTLRDAYDVVLYLGIHHHLPQRERRAVLEGALSRCRELFVVRTPSDVWERDRIDATVRAAGFEPESDHAPSNPSQGRLCSYRRVRPDQRLDARELHFVSFPKSGRTWMRFALAELGVADRIRFEHDGFEYNDGKKPPLDFDPTPRVHRCHRADRVVYMSRDPRDVIVSLFHQVTGRFKDFFGYEGDPAAFVRDPYFGAHNLARFQRMWRGIVDAGLAVHVTYEEAHADFAAVLRKVVDAFGFEFDDARIRAAAEAARFENMKQVERAGSFDEPWLRLRNDAPKVRRGEVGGFRSELSAADRAWLDGLFGDLIAPGPAER